VDIIRSNGEYLILEINSTVSMEKFSLISKNNYQIAKKIYKAALESLINE
jgi:glutathione synthase/RimK-type ligase-like ATP-grasp enzyme